MPKGNPGMSRNTLGKVLAEEQATIIAMFLPFNEERFINSLRAKGLSDSLISSAVKEQKGKSTAQTPERIAAVKDALFNKAKEYWVAEEDAKNSTPAK